MNTTIGAVETTEKSSWNISQTKMDSTFVMLLFSLIFSISWVTYIAYYHSRLVGYIMTKSINRFYIKDGYFKIGICYFVSCFCFN